MLDKNTISFYASIYIRPKHKVCAQEILAESMTRTVLKTWWLQQVVQIRHKRNKIPLERLLQSPGKSNEELTEGNA